MASTGNQTTLTFGTTGFTANIYNISGATFDREALETTHLGTTAFKEYIPDDLVEPGEFEIEFEWNQSFSTFPPISSAAETITVTYPLRSGETTNATLAGTGFVSSSTGPNVANGELLRGQCVVKFDGNVGPAYTAGS